MVCNVPLSNVCQAKQIFLVMCSCIQRIYKGTSTHGLCVLVFKEYIREPVHIGYVFSCLLESMIKSVHICLNTFLCPCKVMMKPVYQVECS